MDSFSVRVAHLSGRIAKLDILSPAPFHLAKPLSKLLVLEGFFLLACFLKQL